MDTPANNFQTSFIPKKPLAEERVPVARHTSIFAFIATLIFFGALAAAAAMYFYKASLTKNIATMNSQLIAARNSFEPSLITTLQVLDRRITDANQLLNNHVVVSPIFAALEVNTLKSVQFTKFSYTTPADPSAPITVRMSGKARDYSAIALESDQLAMNKNIHNSIFSNLALDQQTGTVSFDLVFTVDADLVRFANHLDDLVSQEGTLPEAAASSVPNGTFPGTQSGVSGGGSFPSFPSIGGTTNPPASNPAPSSAGAEGSQLLVPATSN